MDLKPKFSAARLHQVEPGHLMAMKVNDFTRFCLKTRIADSENDPGFVILGKEGDSGRANIIADDIGSVLDFGDGWWIDLTRHLDHVSMDQQDVKNPKAGALLIDENQAVAIQLISETGRPSYYHIDQKIVRASRTPFTAVCNRWDVAFGDRDKPLVIEVFALASKE